jgi:hypothetical protein
MSRLGATAAILAGGWIVGASTSVAAGPLPPIGTVKGHFREVGGPPPGSRQPLPGHIYLRAHGHHVATFPVNKHGQFHGKVPPGRYHVFGRSPRYGNNAVRCPAAHPIHVRDNQTVHVAVTCQAP